MIYEIHTSDSQSYAEIAEYAAAFINATADLNLAYFERLGYAPCLGCEGVKYNPPSKEFRSHRICLKDADFLLREGEGKCNDIVAYFLAWCWYFNIPAELDVVNYNNGLIHVRTRINGVIVDPSENLKNNGYMSSYSNDICGCFSEMVNI